MGTTDADISSVMSSLMSFPSIHNQLTIKLTASNYLLWKTQFTPILHGNQLYCHVDGTASLAREVNGAPNPAYQAWYIKDQLVLSWIFGSLSEPMLSQVVGSTTAISAGRRSYFSSLSFCFPVY
ncbi:hypothetical protein Gotur_027828, partial [Gossypium turneri]